MENRPPPILGPRAATSVLDGRPTLLSSSFSSTRRKVTFSSKKINPRRAALVIPELGPKSPERSSPSTAYSLSWSSRLRALHGLSIRIPDTVLFQNGEPCKWLFTSQKTGTILAKKSSRLQETDILREFGRQAKKIAAAGSPDVGLHQVRKHAEHFIAVARSSVPGRAHLRVEFLRAHQLLDLFQDPKQLRSLISLQVCAGLHSQRGAATYLTELQVLAGKVTVWRLTDDKRVMGVKSERHAAYEATLERFRDQVNRNREVYLKENEIRIPNKVKVVNDALEQIMHDFARSLERQWGKGQVKSLCAEFVDCRGIGLIMTHVVNLEMLQPMNEIEFLATLRGRAEDGSSSSSGRSSNSSIASGLVDPDEPTAIFQHQHQHQHQQQQQQQQQHPHMNQSMSPRDLVTVLAGPRRGYDCWGQYCSLNPCKTEADSVSTNLRQHRGQKLQKQILLAAIARAAAHKVTLQRDGIRFQITGFAKAQDKGVMEDIRSLSTQSSRLYRPVSVCETCFAAYRYLHEARAWWDLTLNTEQGLPDTEMFCIPGVSRSSILVAVSSARDINLAEQNHLARPFFLRSRSEHESHPVRPGCCEACNRACFESARSQSFDSKYVQSMETPVKYLQVNQSAKELERKFVPMEASHSDDLHMHSKGAFTENKTPNTVLDVPDDAVQGIPLGEVVRELVASWEGPTQADLDEFESRRNSKVPPPPRHPPPGHLLSLQNLPSRPNPEPAKTQHHLPKSKISSHTRFELPRRDINGGPLYESGAKGATTTEENIFHITAEKEQYPLQEQWQHVQGTAYSEESAAERLCKEHLDDTFEICQDERIASGQASVLESSHSNGLHTVSGDSHVGESTEGKIDDTDDDLMLLRKHSESGIGGKANEESLYDHRKKSYKNRATSRLGEFQSEDSFPTASNVTPLQKKGVKVTKSYRVARLQSMLSSAISEAQGWHPPLLAIRRKTYIPASQT